MNARVGCPPAVCLTLCLAAMWSCAAPRPADAARMPADFAVSVCVLGGPATDAQVGHAGWLVLDAGNVLHAQTTARSTDSVFPPAVLVLSRDNVERVYQLAREAGALGDAPGVWRIGEEREALPAGPSVRGRGIVMEVMAGGQRRTSLVLPAGTDGGNDTAYAAAARLVQAMDALAYPATAADDVRLPP